MSTSQMIPVLIAVGVLIIELDFENSQTKDEKVSKTASLRLNVANFRESV